MKKPLIIITGPTAVGKTQISIKLAKQLMLKLYQQIYAGI